MYKILYLYTFIIMILCIHSLYIKHKKVLMKKIGSDF